MPPSLASCLFALLILWLLYNSAKKAPRLSVGLWVPAVWVAIIGSMPVTCWLKGRDSDLNFNAYVEGSPADRNVCLILLFLAIIILMRRRIIWNQVFTRNRWLWFFYLFGCISVVWSDDPFVAFKRWIREIGNIVMIFVILTEADPAEAVSLVFVRCAYVLITLSILLMMYYLEMARYYTAS